MATAHLHSPLGTVEIVEESGFVTAISISDGTNETSADVSGNLVLAQAVNELSEYFEGIRKEFTFPVKQPGTVFQQAVWQQLMHTGFGKTCSYAQLSAQMNSPLAIRAIAAANGKNKLWIVVPCHRIIGTDGSLTGYAGGLWRKKWLLEHEAAVCGRAQMQLAF